MILTKSLSSTILQRKTNPVSFATRGRKRDMNALCADPAVHESPFYGSRGSGEPGVHSPEPSMRHRSTFTFDPDKPHSVLLILVQSAWYFRIKLWRNISPSEKNLDIHFWCRNISIFVRMEFRLHLSKYYQMLYYWQLFQENCLILWPVILLWNLDEGWH